MRHLLKELSFLLAIVAFICISSGTTTFAAVVLTGSMEPELNVGDIILCHGSFINTLEPKKGDIIVYKLANSTMDIPIVHRVIDTKPTLKGTQLLTKGDANNVDDRILWKQYGRPKQWLDTAEVNSIVYARIPPPRDASCVGLKAYSGENGDGLWYYTR